MPQHLTTDTLTALMEGQVAMTLHRAHKHAVIILNAPHRPSPKKNALRTIYFPSKNRVKMMSLAHTHLRLGEGSATGSSIKRAFHRPMDLLAFIVLERSSPIKATSSLYATHQFWVLARTLRRSSDVRVLLGAGNAVRASKDVELTKIEV